MAHADTAWGYLAVSSGRQEETLEHQERWITETAAKHGWQLTRVFGRGREGVGSGKAGVRKILESLLAELKAVPRSQRPHRVLMIRLDRLGRGDGLDAIGAFAEIRKLGVIIHTRQDGDNTIKSALDAIKPILEIITGGLENEARSDKSRAMHARKLAAGEWRGLPPYGFVVVDKKLAMYEPEAAFVREVFALRARGWSLSKLSKHARENAPGKRRKDGGTKKFRWHTTTLTVLLRNRVYRGTVIPEDEFDELPRDLEPIAIRSPKHPWPLRGALKCTCGLKVTGRISGVGGKYQGKYQHRYYICPDYAAHNGYPGHRADDIERQFLELLQRLIADPSLVTSYRAEQEDLEDLRAQRKALESERDGVLQRRDRVWRLAEDDRIPTDEVARRLEELKAELDRQAVALAGIERKIERVKASKAHLDGVAEALTSFLEGWPKMSVELRREAALAVGALIGGLWVDPKEQGILRYKHGESVR